MTTYFDNGVAQGFMLTPIPQISSVQGVYDTVAGTREGATIFQPENKYSPLPFVSGYANGEPDSGTPATHDASAGAVPSFTTAKRGSIAVVTVAGTLNGISVAKGDLLHALQDNPTTAAHWAIIADCTSEWEAAVEAADKGELWLYGTYLCVDSNPEGSATIRGEAIWLNRCQKTFLFQYNQASPGTSDNLAYFTANSTISTLSAVTMAVANDPYTAGTMNRVTRLTLTTAAEAANFNVGGIVEVTCDTQTPSTAGGAGSFVAAPAKIQYIDTVNGYLYLDHKIGWYTTIAAATNKCVALMPQGRSWDIEGVTLMGAPTIIGESVGWWKTLFGDEVTGTITGSSGSSRTITRSGHNMIAGQYVQVGATTGTEDTSCVVSNVTATTFDITVPAKKDLDSGGAASVATSGTIYYRPVFNCSEVNTNHHGAHTILYHAHGSRADVKHARLWAKGLSAKRSNYCRFKREGVGQHAINPLTRFDNNINTGRLMYDTEAWNSGRCVFEGSGISNRHGYTSNMTETSTSYAATLAWIGRYAGACVNNIVRETGEGGVSTADSHADEWGLEVIGSIIFPTMHPFAESYYAGTHNIRGMNEKRTERQRGGYKGLVVESVEREAGNWVDVDLDYSDLPYTSTSQVAFEVKSHATRTNPPTIVGKIKFRNAGIGAKFANNVEVRLSDYTYTDVAKYGMYLVGDANVNIARVNLDYTMNTEGQTTRSAIQMDDTASFSAGVLSITMGATYNPTEIFTDGDNDAGKSVTVGTLIINDPNLVGIPALVTAGREANFTTLNIGTVIYNGQILTNRSFISGRYYGPSLFAVFSTRGVTANSVRAVPVLVDSQKAMVGFSGIAFWATANASSGNVKLAVYKDSSGIPGAKVSGTDITVTNPATGSTIDAAFSATVYLPRGKYWLAMITDQTITFTAIGTSAPVVGNVSGLGVLTAGSAGVEISDTGQTYAGGLPATFGTVTYSEGTATPYMALKVA